MNKSIAGFTLIELLLVVALIALLVGLSGSYAVSLHRLYVRSEVSALHTTCLYLQRKAMITNRSQELTLNPIHHSYAYDNTTYQLPAAVRFGASKGAKGPPSNPSHAITKPVTFTENKIVFHPDGVIKAGAIYLTDQKGTVTYALSCSVAHVSYIRMYQYHTGSWKLL